MAITNDCSTDHGVLRALQDLAPIHCFGCGALNEHGLQIKSYAHGDELLCRWQPRPYHIGHPGILYGGMIASIVDCHCVWAAMAHAHRVACVELDGELRYRYVTASLAVDYRRPVAIDAALELSARVVEFSARKAIVHCRVSSQDVTSADARVVAVRMAGELPDPREPG